MIRVTGYPTLEVGLLQLRKFIREQEELGRRTLIFCEDRLTLLAEQAVCEEMGGSFLTSVSTFARFLQHSGRTLSKQASVMVIGKLLSANREKLHCFSSRAGAKNGARAVYEMISQLAASKVTPEMLLSDQTENGLLKDKLFDLALLYGAYEDFLRENDWLDENSYLSLLPRAIMSDEKTVSANIVFFGFSSFTAQALDGVRAACERANNVLGLFPAGMGGMYTNQAATSFKKTCQEYGEVKVSLVKIAPENKRLCDHLRDCLYKPASLAERTGEERLSCGKNIHIYAARNEEEELRYVCAQIKKYVADGGRFNEVSVFVPDLNGYALTLDKVFKEYNVPYYSDKKRKLSEHPFACFLFAILRAVAENCSPVSVQQVASSCYFGDSGVYRNYLSKFCNYRGGAKKEIKTGEGVKDYLPYYDYLCDMRERLLSGMGIFSNKMSGKNFCEGVRKLYQLFRVKEITDDLMKVCKDELQKNYLDRMENTLENILSESELWLGEDVLTAAEFCDVLKNGLEACELSLIPLHADGVFVGDIAQSRTGGTPLVFALGMTDKVPYCGEDTALLSDGDMQKLQEVKIKIEPSVAQVNERTRENVCLNVTSFTQAVFFTYPTEGQDEVRRSDIISYVENVFNDIERDREEDFIFSVSEPVPAIRALLLHKDDYLEGKENEREKYASLYVALSKLPAYKEHVERVFTDMPPTDSIQNAEKLFFKQGELSPTLLENYFTCPYRNFSERGLKIKAREETAVLATDSGTFVHAVLEAVAKQINYINDREECRIYAMDTAEKLLYKPRYNSLLDTASGEYTGKRLIDECAGIAVEMYDQIVGSNFRVKYTEYTCFLPEEKLHGKIDRVDECNDLVRIIDYKTGSIDTAAESYYIGRKLQLQLYMSAVSKDKTPAGIYYFPASIKYHKEEEEPFRMVGFSNGSEEVVKNSDTVRQEGQDSRFVELAKSARTDRVMEEEEFKHFIRYSVLSSRKGAEEIKSGFIAPTPYGAACEYCPYKGMCGSFGEKTVRDVEGKVTCKGIAKIVRELETGETEQAEEEKKEV